MKQVRETVAGKSISAWVILKKGKEVAAVQAHYSNSRVLINIWDKASGYDMQVGSAGGYGYDKFTSALSGLTIGGITLNDHCGTDKRTTRLLKAYHNGTITLEQAEKRAAKIGARFANWQTDKGQWMSLFLEPGLDKLKCLGFTVIQAI